MYGSLSQIFFHNRGWQMEDQPRLAIVTGAAVRLGRAIATGLPGVMVCNWIALLPFFPPG
jgi:hypothetical protein